MYADTHEALDEALTQIEDHLIEDHDVFWERLQKNLERQKEWVELYRVEEVTKSDDTNNFTEATIRIMKEIMLNGTKDFNVVALVEYCSTFWDQYCKYTLLEFAHNLHPQPLRIYDRLCRNMADCNPELALLANKIDADTYEIPSVSTLDKVYSIDVSVGMCNCPNGNQGTFCKHQAWLHKHFSTTFPSVPDLTVTDRQFLAQLALGESCPDESFFEDDHCKDSSETCDDKNDLFNAIKNEVNPEPKNEETVDAVDYKIFEQCEPAEPVDAGTNIEEKCKLAITRVANSLMRFSELLTSEPSSIHLDALLKLEQKLCKVRSCSEATDVLLDVTAAVSARVRTDGEKAIHPTSLARCRDESAPEPKRRCLAENAEQNIDIAKSHDSSCGGKGLGIRQSPKAFDGAFCNFII